MHCTPKFRTRRYQPRTGAVALTPELMARVYDLPSVKATRSPVIGILELEGGYHDSDNATAFSHMGQPVPTMQNISVSTAGNAVGGPADGEVALDIQVAAGVCQKMAGRKATVVLAWAPNNGGASFAAGITALVTAGVDTISISWGAAERQWSATDRMAVGDAIDKANAAGIPVFAASGDAGAGDGFLSPNVDFPASYPGTIGCGGTTLTYNSDLTYGSESVWHDRAGDGTGGGFSRVYLRPSWQGANSGSSFRGVPDVAGPADPAGPGWRIVLNGEIQPIGGTSAVAPMWAGIVAALKAAGYSGRTFGPSLYAHAWAFNDVLSGDNGRFPAVPGWDACTGLGSPNGAALVGAMSLETPATPVMPAVPAVPAAPTMPPPAPAPVLLAQAQAAAVQGVEDAARRSPLLAPLIRQCEPDVRNRLAALWQPPGATTHMEPRTLNLAGLLVTLQTIMQDIQIVLTTLGQITPPPASSPPASSPTAPHASTGSISQDTIDADLGAVSAAYGTFSTDNAALSAAQAAVATAQATVATDQDGLQTALAQLQTDVAAFIAQNTPTPATPPVPATMHASKPRDEEEDEDETDDYSTVSLDGLKPLGAQVLVTYGPV